MSSRRSYILAILCGIIAQSVSVGCSAPRPLRQFSIPDGFAVAAAFSPDGRWVAAGDAEGVVRVWEAATGKLLAQRDGYDLPRSPSQRTIAFSLDGMTVAFAAKDGVELWEWSTEQAWRLDPESKPLADILFTDKTVVIASGGHHAVPGEVTATREPLVVTRWDLDSRGMLSQIEDDTSGALNAALSPDGRLFAMNCVEGTPRRFDHLTPQTPLRAILRICDTATGQVHGSVTLEPGQGAWHLVFSPDGQSIFTSLLMGTEHGWVRHVRNLHVSRAVAIGAAIFSEDGRRLMSLHVERVGVFHLIMPVAAQRGDWRLVVVDLETGQRRSRRIKLPEEHREGLEPLAFTRDLRLLVDRALRLWEMPQP